MLDIKVLTIGRIAGQYGKPRTNKYEIIDKSYRNLTNRLSFII